MKNGHVLQWFKTRVLPKLALIRGWLGRSHPSEAFAVVALGSNACNVVSACAERIKEMGGRSYFVKGDGHRNLARLLDVIHARKTHMVIGVVTLGGYFGAQVAPQFMQLAIQSSMPIRMMAFEPFSFEGERRMHAARLSLWAMQDLDRNVVYLYSNEQNSLTEETHWQAFTRGHQGFLDFVQQSLKVAP